MIVSTSDATVEAFLLASLRRSLENLLETIEILSRLRKKFIERCAEQRNQIALAATAWQVDGDIAARTELLRLVHGLAGAGGTLGFDRLSRIAADAEAALEAPGACSPAPAIADLLAEIDSIAADRE